MSLQTLNPPGLLSPEGYVQVTVAQGTRLIHVAGQTARDPEGRLIADDLAGQTTAAIANVATALAGAGAAMTDIASATLLVVGFRHEQMADLMDGATRAAAAGNVLVTAVTLIPVTILAEEGVLIEIAATAVIT